MSLQELDEVLCFEYFCMLVNKIMSFFFFFEIFGHIQNTNRADIHFSISFDYS